MGKLEHRECLVCGDPFTTYPSQNKRYCSQQCKGVVRRKSDSEFAARVRNTSVPLGHPLVTPGKRQVQLHRLLLWEAIGPGSHPCWRCGKFVTWAVGSYTAKGSLVVDHADRNPLNNDLSNLRPSCQGCNNLNKERAIRDDEVFNVLPDGRRVRGEYRNCEQCGAEFVAWRSRPGKFCSRSCLGRANRAARWRKVA